MRKTICDNREDEGPIVNIKYEDFRKKLYTKLCAYHSLTYVCYITLALSILSS